MGKETSRIMGGALVEKTFRLKQAPTLAMQGWVKKPLELRVLKVGQSKDDRPFKWEE